MLNAQKNVQNSNGIMSQKEQCSHRHGGRKKVTESEDVLAPPSPIQEETEQDVEDVFMTADTIERPRTGKSTQSSASASSRPGSQLFGVRPASSRSTFESIPGTRPASRRVSIFVNSLDYCKKF